MSAPKSVLMIAYHFPPLAGSSGIQRTLRFVQHLPGFGWRAAVLTASPHAYERTSGDLLADVPPSTVVRRAFALDAARHLAFKGRYLGALARPDRWVSWRFDGVRQGLKLIATLKPKAIWSTYPIATAHLIGAELHRRSGLPWIADFRDPMAQPGYPSDPQTWQQYDAIERHATEHAALSVFTTRGAARVYRERYPASAERIVVIENGYDEESFALAEASKPTPTALHPGILTLLHSGIVYPKERDPTQLFAALRRLNDSGHIRTDTFRIRFRAAVHDESLRGLARDHGVEAYIETCPPVSYEDALQEMRCADALLVIQASDCNEQIPGKVYEYLRAGRPILCLSDSRGDTVALLRAAGVNSIAAIDAPEEIAPRIVEFLAAVREGRADLPTPEAVRSASRHHRAELLARRLDEVAA
jgi:glycosyltransferase involved in cell wall biosynthesis